MSAEERHIETAVKKLTGAVRVASSQHVGQNGSGRQLARFYLPDGLIGICQIKAGRQVEIFVQPVYHFISCFNEEGQCEARKGRQGDENAVSEFRNANWELLAQATWGTIPPSLRSAKVDIFAQASG